MFKGLAVLTPKKQSRNAFIDIIVALAIAAVLSCSKPSLGMWSLRSLHLILTATMLGSSISNIDEYSCCSSQHLALLAEEVNEGCKQGIGLCQKV